ncbi:MAG: hypothetical protein MRERC_2c114 [Mycoplasmataceae bacterium RC_NB112A]|nr:MAG: hypothetical protein MRERC_2c114 [Mycoplasmataceae bacterium RC_NB112A]
MLYVAPEVLRQHPYAQASDIYYFEIVVYEILSGLFPFAGSFWFQINWFRK